ncbi:hypothetical protein FACS189465_3120 [Clostridia bacterium]|nr:hypothetical protein FACS189465_3120 [Clostridia bacterium]
MKIFLKKFVAMGISTVCLGALSNFSGEFESENGFMGLKRNIIMRLFRIIQSEKCETNTVIKLNNEKIRTLIFCKEILDWTKLSIFRWACELRIQNREDDIHLVNKIIDEEKKDNRNPENYPLLTKTTKKLPFINMDGTKCFLLLIILYDKKYDAAEAILRLVDDINDPHQLLIKRREREPNFLQLIGTYILLPEAFKLLVKHNVDINVADWDEKSLLMPLVKFGFGNKIVDNNCQEVAKLRDDIQLCTCQLIESKKVPINTIENFQTPFDVIINCLRRKNENYKSRREYYWFSITIPRLLTYEELVKRFNLLANYFKNIERKDYSIVLCIDKQEKIR